MTLLVLLVAILVLLRRGRGEGPYGPIHLLVYAFAYGALFRGIVLRADPAQSLEGSPIRTDRLAIENIELILALGVFAIVAGTYGRKRPVGKALPRDAKDPRGLFGMLLLVSVGCIAVFFLVLSLNNSLAATIVALRGRSVDVLAGEAFLGLLLTVASVLGLAADRAAAASQRLALRRINLLLQIGVVGGLYFTGGRGAPATHILGLFALRWLRDQRARQNKVRLLVAGSLFAGILVFGFASRQAAQQNVPIADALGQLDVIESLSSSYPMSDSVSLGAEFARRRGHDFGAEYVSLPALFVPRSVWPDKPAALQLRIREEFYGDRQTGIPPGYFGELLIAGGPLAVMLGGFVLGRVLKRLQASWVEAQSRPELAVGITSLSTTICIDTLRSGVEIGAVLVVVVLLSLFVVRCLEGFRRRYARPRLGAASPRPVPIPVALPPAPVSIDWPARV